MIRISLAVLLAAQAAASSPRTAITQEQADAFAQKLESLRESKTPARKKDGARDAVIVTEGELNSYLNYTLGPSLPAGLSDVELQLDRDRLHGTASVDMEQVKKELGNLSPWNPLSLLSGRVPVEVTGRYLAAEDGFGRIEVQEARLAGVTVPMAMLEQIVAGATRTSSDPDGFDIHAPFRLPPPVRRVRVMPGRAFLDL
jgi:hypothetical protein